METNKKAQAFQNLQLGVSSPTGIKLEEIKIHVSFADMGQDYTKFFIQAARARNVLKFDATGLTYDDLEAYFDYLLKERIKAVEGNCKDWRKLKTLYIPSYFQHVLNNVGRVDRYDIGISFIPEYVGESEMTFEDAQDISVKLGYLATEVSLELDAMPRTPFGNPDAMSCVIIADYVRALSPVQHVASSYIAAFLNAKLAQEVAFSAIYRVQYDDVDFIRGALTRSEAIY